MYIYICIYLHLYIYIIHICIYIYIYRCIPSRFCCNTPTFCCNTPTFCCNTPRHDRFHRKRYHPEIHQIEKLVILDTNLDETKISTGICTARFRGLWISRFGGFWDVAFSVETVIGVLHLKWELPSISAIEPCVSVKEPYISAKEPCISATEYFVLPISFAHV